MPRSRRRRTEPSRSTDSFERMLAGWKRTEIRRGQEWTVQPVSGAQAQKEYLCPGCGQAISSGVAHLVAWRADGILGDEAALADRRHWHSHCWRIG